MRRFYKDVAITDDLGIALDGRSVKTPARETLILPNRALAETVAAEWEAQDAKIDPRSMPMTGLANAVIDKVAPDPSAFAGSLAQYGESELLCYRADTQPDLATRQSREWDPLLDWARGRYDVSFTTVHGVMHHPQPAETLARLSDAIAARSAWELAPLQPIITITGSLVVGLALAEVEIAPQRAFDTAHLDELWQAELWGEDHFALEARASRLADFLSACRFLDLVRG
jgi:chaperone required for assembly of F1-ATPase